MDKASGENCCTKCLISCISCCLDCFDRFLRFLCSNAYIYMAISGDSFCTSAIHAFLLVLKNRAKFAFVNGIEGVFMFLAKFAISVFTTLFGWFLIVVWVNQEPGQNVSAFIPSLFIFLFAYVVAAIFIGIFEVSANTILQCFLIDLDIAKQNNLDPKHVPERLAKFLETHGDHKVTSVSVKENGVINSQPLLPEQNTMV